MYNVFESESIVFKEQDLFYHVIMGFNLFNHIFVSYIFGGLQKTVLKLVGFTWSYFPLFIICDHKYDGDKYLCQ